MNLEWLSVYVEDCFSNRGSCFPATGLVHVPLQAAITSCKQRSEDSSGPLQNFAVPGKARSKRRRATPPQIRASSWSHSLLKFQPLPLASSDPPLLQQPFWLADSELILPKKESAPVTRDGELPSSAEVASEEVTGIPLPEPQSVPRRCSHCLSHKTPQWRAGPLGPKSLCNACGVRYKSGRLLPEYRPAKSPTFVSYLHSNSHKKVMEMRTAPVSSIPGDK